MRSAVSVMLDVALHMLGDDVGGLAVPSLGPATTFDRRHPQGQKSLACTPVSRLSGCTR